MEPPGNFEKGVRFGCGFIFGCFIAVVSGLAYFLWDTRYVAAACLVLALAFGYLAMKFGDRFWTKLGWIWSMPWRGPWW